MRQGIDLEGALVVTGAASGIGEGIARTAAEHGMQLVLADIVEDRLAALADELVREGAEAVAVPTDVGDPAALEHLADVAFSSFDGVRALINNAGVEAAGYTWETTPETFERVVRVNLIGVFNGVRAFVPRLLEQGTEASILNVASIAALLSGPMLQSAYNASKHGVLGLTETLLLELTHLGAPITVHVATPGPVATRILSDAKIEGSGARSFHRGLSRMVSETGLTGRAAGELILAGISRGEFWICTHPDWQDAASRRRAAMLVERTSPSDSTAGVPGALGAYPSDP